MYMKVSNALQKDAGISDQPIWSASDMINYGGSVGDIGVRKYANIQASCVLATILQ
jgi:hypothetical protein